MDLEPERLALCVEKIKATPFGSERLARERCGVSTELCQRSADRPRRGTDRARDDLGFGFDRGGGAGRRGQSASLTCHGVTICGFERHALNMSIVPGAFLPKNSCKVASNSPSRSAPSRLCLQRATVALSRDFHAI
jgi:hypothetical protein